jgi:hypothetical protein
MKYLITENQLKLIKKYMKNFINEEMSDDDRERYNDRGDAQSYPESNGVSGKVLININNSRNPKDDNVIYVNIDVDVNDEGIADAFLNIEKDITAGTVQMEGQKLNFIRNYFRKLMVTKKLIPFIENLVTTYGDKKLDVLEFFTEYNEDTFNADDMYLDEFRL